MIQISGIFSEIPDFRSKFIDPIFDSRMIHKCENMFNNIQKNTYVSISLHLIKLPKKIEIIKIRKTLNIFINVSSIFKLFVL